MRTGRQILLAVASVVLLAMGAAAATGAIWLLSTFGDDGRMSFAAGTITPQPGSSATIVDVERFGASIPYVGERGTTTLAVSTGDRGDPTAVLFLGAAATQDVDAYLAGAPYTVAYRDPSVTGGWVTRAVPGQAVPVAPRGGLPWLAEDVGQRPDIEVPDQRPLTIVVMHPAGVATGPVGVSIDVTVPEAPRWGLGLAVAAGALVFAGLVLLVWVLRARRPRAADPAVA